MGAHLPDLIQSGARWSAGGRSLKAQFRHADALRARYVAILGDQELAKGRGRAT